jgi:Putative F0F1-ATPase subunit Ca2+/Mg2+ transporter
MAQHRTIPKDVPGRTLRSTNGWPSSTGLWLDKRFGTAPVFVLLGVLLGFASSGYYFYQTVRKLGGEVPAKPRE